MNEYTSRIVAQQQMADRVREAEKRELARVARQHKNAGSRHGLATRAGVGTRARLGRLVFAIFD